MATASLVLVASAATARAQSPEFELAEDGTWPQVSAADAASDEGVIARARALVADGQAAMAKRVINDWLEGAIERGSPWLSHGYLIRGDAKVALGDEYLALFDYDRILKDYPESDQYVKALEREFEIARRYVNGLHRRFLGLRVMRAETEGEVLLVLIQRRLPGSALAERAALELGDYYYRNGRIAPALEQYEVFLQNFPQSRHRSLAMARRVHASIARASGPRHDTSGLVEARALIRAYAARYPVAAQEAQLTDALQSRVDEALGAKLLETASWYLDRGDDVSARFTLKRLLAQHPQTVAAARATRVMLERGWIEEAATPGPAGPDVLPAGEGAP